MTWAGSPFAQLVEFSTGSPTGAVSYSLLGNDGAELLSDSITPNAGAVSALIVIPGTLNSCTLPLFENRTLTWSYLTATGLVEGRAAYRVDKPLPFPVTIDGVRAKLGVAGTEVDEKAVDLVLAYSEFVTMLPSAPDATTGDRAALLSTHAIEAIAGLQILPLLQLMIAQRESSGTNEYQRYQSIDWQMIEGQLTNYLLRARQELDPSFDPLGTDVFVFGKVARSDGFTGV